jgi:hypothetical protein
VCTLLRVTQQPGLRGTGRKQRKVSEAIFLLTVILMLRALSTELSLQLRSYVFEKPRGRKIRWLVNNEILEVDALWPRLCLTKLIYVAYSFTEHN